MSRLRVINLGLPKTGTTTLSRALRRAGLHVADWRIHDRQTKRDDIKGRLVGQILYRDYFETGDPLARLEEFDAVTEMNALRPDNNFWPQTDFGLINALERHHPGVRFVLSRRDPEATARSMMNWGNLGEKRLPDNDVPGLPRGFGGSVSDLMRWIEGHHAFCRRVFAGKGNFMEYDPADPEVRAKLGGFLGIEMPWWGRANARRPAPEREAG